MAETRAEKAAKVRANLAKYMHDANPNGHVLVPRSTCLLLDIPPGSGTETTFDAVKPDLQGNQYHERTSLCRIKVSDFLVLADIPAREEVSIVVAKAFGPEITG